MDHGTSPPSGPSTSSSAAAAGTPPPPGAGHHQPPPLLDKILSRVRLRVLGRARAGSGVSGASGASGAGRRGSEGSVPLRTRGAGAGAGGGTEQESGEEPPAPRRTASEAAAVSPGATDSDSVLSTASSGCLFTDPLESAERKFKVKDLGPFCEQLDRLLDYIHSTKDLYNLIYNYPSKLQSSLDSKALELRTLYLEARAARLRIQQVKNQRKAVRKECNTVEKTLVKLKEEEVKEMENYISLYDKTLLSRWEKIKSSNQQDVIESFMHDIKGKQKALDYLHTLASNKLNQLRNHPVQLPAVEESKPVSLALRRLSANGGTRLQRWRNKHHEKPVRVPVTNNTQETNQSLPIVPLATLPFSLNLAPAFTGETSSEGSSRTSSPSTFGSASSSLIPNNTSAIPNIQRQNNLNTSPPTPNTPERRSILQALFSDIQHPGTHDNLPINAIMPRLVAASSAAARIGVGVAENQNGNSLTPPQNNNDIELYTMDDPP